MMAPRRALAAVALLLCLGAANAACVNQITGYSGTFGKRVAGHLDRFSNQTTQWRAKGAVTRVAGYVSATTHCVLGVKAQYGYDARDARLIGQEQGLVASELVLDEGEHISKVQIKSGDCVELLRFVTNKGRVLELGNRAGAATTITSYPNRPTGFLAALRGFEEYTKLSTGATARGPLRTLQFVWANCNSVPGSATAGLSLESGSVGNLADAAADAAAGGCPALTDMCSTKAASTSTAYCPAVAPFKRAQCLGGCCVSSGKCTSSSCAISGLGKEAPNTICYGLNPAIAIGASPNCRGLACKLAVPGCTSDLLGGSCVGTVVDLSGAAATKNPAGAELVGMPCLDVTPSDKTMTKDGALTATGEYVAKLWSVCDCAAAAAGAADDKAAATGAFGLPKMGRFNFTDLKVLADALKPNSTHPLAGVLGAVKSKIPGLSALPADAAVNATSALTYLGSLVSKGGEGAEGVAAVVEMLKGASAAAAAANGTNPVTALLGAIKGAGAGGAGSSDIASAVGQLLAGGDGAPVELANVLSKLKALNSTGKLDVQGLMAKAQQALSAGGAAGGDSGAVAQLVAGLQALGNGEAGGAGGLGGLLSKAGNGTAAVQGLLSKAGIADLAAKAGPALQQLQAASAGDGAAGEGGLAGLAAKLGPALQALQNGNAGGGVPGAGGLAKMLGGAAADNPNLKALVDAAQKAGPLLQALQKAGGQGSAAAAAGAPAAEAALEAAEPVAAAAKA